MLEQRLVEVLGGQFYVQRTQDCLTAKTEQFLLLKRELNVKYSCHGAAFHSAVKTVF